MISLLGVCVCGKYPKLEYWSAMLRVWCKRQPNEISKYNQPKERVFFWLVCQCSGLRNAQKWLEFTSSGANEKLRTQWKGMPLSHFPARLFPPYKALMVLRSTNVSLVPFSVSVNDFVMKKRIRSILVYLFLFYLIFIYLISWIHLKSPLPPPCARRCLQVCQPSHQPSALCKPQP